MVVTGVVFSTEVRSLVGSSLLGGSWKSDTRRPDDNLLGLYTMLVALIFHYLFFMRYKVPIFHCSGRGQRYFAIYLPPLTVFCFRLRMAWGAVATCFTPNAEEEESAFSTAAAHKIYILPSICFLRDLSDNMVLPPQGRRGQLQHVDQGITVRRKQYALVHVS